MVRFWAAMGLVGGSDRAENALGGFVKGSFQGSSVCSAKYTVQQRVSGRGPLKC